MAEIGNGGRDKDCIRAYIQREERKSAPRPWMDIGKTPGKNAGFQGAVILKVDRTGLQV